MTAECTKIMTEATKGIGHKYRKGSRKDYFTFASWFSSNKSAEAAMEVGSDFIGMFITYTKGFYKETIENITKDCPGVDNPVFRSKPMVPGGSPLIAIEYKYNP